MTFLSTVRIFPINKEKGVAKKGRVANKGRGQDSKNISLQPRSFCYKMLPYKSMPWKITLFTYVAGYILYASETS